MELSIVSFGFVCEFCTTDSIDLCVTKKIFVFRENWIFFYVKATLMNTIWAHVWILFLNNRVSEIESLRENFNYKFSLSKILNFLYFSLNSLTQLFEFIVHPKVQLD